MKLSRVSFPALRVWVFIFSGFCFLAPFYGCVSDPANQASDARTKFQKGLEYGSLNNQQEMIASFKEAVELEPGNEQYRIHLATGYFLLNDLKNAEKEYLEVLKINRDSKDAYRQLGRLYMRKGNWDQAVKNFEKDLSRPGIKQPQQVFNWLALSYYNQGKFKQAERQWLKAIELKDNAGIRLNLALAYKDREQFDQALESLQKAVALNPNFPQAHYEMSQLLIKKSEMKEAVNHFKEVIRLAPKSEWAQLSRKYLDLIQQP